MGLTDLPPELMLYLSTFLTESSLEALIPTSKKYAYLLTKQLYDTNLLEPWLDGPDYGLRGRKLKDPWKCAIEWKSSLIVTYFSSVPLERWRDKDAITWVHFFAYSGNQQLLELMISRGLPFDVYRDASTPLYLATSKMHTGIVRFLLSLGGNMHEGSNSSGRLMSSFERAFRTESVEIVEMFVEALGDVNSDIPINASGGYIKALHLAAEVGSGPITELLLARGADPFAYCYYGGRFNVSNQRWQTALHLACRHGFFGPCPALVRSMKAIKGGNGSLSPLDSSGNTPLHVAIEGRPGYFDWRSDYPAVIRLLIESGADLSTWNLRGQTLMDATITSDHRELAVGLLKEHGPWRNGVWEVNKDPEDYYGYLAELFTL